MSTRRRSGSPQRGLAPLADAVRTQLWPLPVTSVVLAIALGSGLIALDERAQATVLTSAQFLLFGGDASAARSVLETTAGSLITVTSLTFSLTVVTLQLASSQYSPRLLRTFTADRFVQATLALFLSTFVFALTVLRSVRDGDQTSDGFVPRLSVTWAFVMTIACVVALVLFLAHLAREIRVETMLDAVRRDSARTVGRMITDEDDHRDIVVPPDALPVPAGRSGFLLSVDVRRLCALADELGVTVTVLFPPGEFLVQGTPWAVVWPVPAHDADQVAARMQKGLRVGVERSGGTDISFGLRQIVDVATKALSPGINDPTTAVHAIDAGAALLRLLATKDLRPTVVLADDGDRVLLVLAQSSFADLLSLAYDQPRRYGSGDPQVVAALLQGLRALAWTVGRQHHHLIMDQLDLLKAALSAGRPDPPARVELDRRIREVEAALEHRWAAPTNPVDADSAAVGSAAVGSAEVGSPGDRIG